MHAKRVGLTCRASRKKQIGAATAIDMVLTLPLFVAMMLFIIQMALVLHAYTVVQYSAYKAARSARVYVLDGDHAFLGLDLPEIIDAAISLPNAGIILDSLLGDGTITGLFSEVQERTNAAAMNQLVSISPATSSYNVGGQGDSYDEVSVRQYLEAASVDYPTDYSINRVEPMMRKALYAYSDANTTVEFKFIDFDNPLLQESEDVWRIYETIRNTPLHSQVDIPITVTVRYRYELQIPIGQVFFANDTTRPSRYGRWMEATVKLM